MFTLLRHLLSKQHYWYEPLNTMERAIPTSIHPHLAIPTPVHLLLYFLDFFAFFMSLMRLVGPLDKLTLKVAASSGVIQGWATA